MLQQLEAYYLKNGILSTSFTCPHQNDCRGNCESFTGPKSPFVSSGYESHEYPRLLFLSLDSGSGDQDPRKGLPMAVRRYEEWERDFDKLHKGKHWYRTHELAWYILKRFHPRLGIGEARRFFAHSNSAKCCMNKSQRKKADNHLFRNCRGYLEGELAVLAPNILVTQGQEAKSGIELIAQEPRMQIDRFASIIRLNGLPVFWLHTYHPNNYGAFNAQRDFDKGSEIALGWERYSRMIEEFIADKSHESGIG